ncbi:hypothetical protein DFH09DRAFT_1406863, partial [Mycena vulgaris]
GVLEAAPRAPARQRTYGRGVCSGGAVARTRGSSSRSSSCTRTSDKSVHLSAAPLAVQPACLALAILPLTSAVPARVTAVSLSRSPSLVARPRPATCMLMRPAPRMRRYSRRRWNGAALHHLCAAPALRPAAACTHAVQNRSRAPHDGVRAPHRAPLISRSCF